MHNTFDGLDFTTLFALGFPHYCTSVQTVVKYRR